MAATPLSKDKKEIAGMFDSIAPRYDFLNHLLSLNIDRTWRRKLVKCAISNNPACILDLACGTGDVSRALSEKNIKVTGLDISENMLSIARTKKCKGPAITYINGPADDIPFPDNNFDAVTISFGIRNFDKRETCLEEIYRVLSPEGTLAILEFSIPRNRLWKAVYTFYFTRFLPIIGRAVSHQQFAYSYLPQSALEFPKMEDFCNELSSAGFKNVTSRPLSGGIACIYLGIK